VKLKHLLVLMSTAMSLQPSVSSGHEPQCGSFAQAAGAFDVGNFVSMNPRELSCDATQGQTATVATPRGEADRTKVIALPASGSRDGANEAEELGREPYRMLLATVAMMLFLSRRRGRGD
jgi:hypothetical protein